MLAQKEDVFEETCETIFELNQDDIARYWAEAREEGLRIARTNEKLHKDEIARKDRALAEKDNALAERDNEIAKKDNEIAEKDNALTEKDSALAEKDNEIEKKDAQIALLMEQLKEKSQQDDNV